MGPEEVFGKMDWSKMQRGALGTLLKSKPEEMAAFFGKAGRKSRSGEQILNAGYRRMGYLGGAAGAAGAYGGYRHFRSSARDGLRGRSSGGY